MVKCKGGTLIIHNIRSENIPDLMLSMKKGFNTLFLVLHIHFYLCSLKHSSIFVCL